MNLEKYVDDYLHEWADKLEHMKSFFEEKELIPILFNASTGILDDNKMNQHQWRVGKLRAQQGVEILKLEERAILSSKSFEDIFNITEKVRKEITGLGDLWSYDTALRIGFNLGIYPTRVYVQCGVKNGLKLVLGSIPRGRSLPINIFGPDLRVLKPYQIENFLCIIGKKSKKKSAC